MLSILAPTLLHATTTLVACPPEKVTDAPERLQRLIEVAPEDGDRVRRVRPKVAEGRLLVREGDGGRFVLRGGEGDGDRFVLRGGEGDGGRFVLREGDADGNVIVLREGVPTAITLRDGDEPKVITRSGKAVVIGDGDAERKAMGFFIGGPEGDDADGEAKVWSFELPGGMGKGSIKLFLDGTHGGPRAFAFDADGFFPEEIGEQLGQFMHEFEFDGEGMQGLRFDPKVMEGFEVFGDLEELDVDVAELKGLFEGSMVEMQRELQGAFKELEGLEMRDLPRLGMQLQQKLNQHGIRPGQMNAEQLEQSIRDAVEKALRENLGDLEAELGDLPTMLRQRIGEARAHAAELHGHAGHDHADDHAIGIEIEAAEMHGLAERMRAEAMERAEQARAMAMEQAHRAQKEARAAAEQARAMAMEQAEQARAMAMEQAQRAQAEARAAAEQAMQQARAIAAEAKAHDHDHGHDHDGDGRIEALEERLDRLESKLERLIRAIEKKLGD